MSITLNKEAYSKLIQEDIDWLLKNTEHDLERTHIIDVLKESIKYHYPENRYCDGTFKDSRDWPDTNCHRCDYFDGYDICMCKNNFGSITTDRLNY